MRLYHFLLVVAIVVGGATSHPIEKSSTCTDDRRLKFRVKRLRKKKKCRWVAKKPNKRCNKRSPDNGGKKLKILCPAACDNCPDDTPTPPTSAPVNAPTLSPVSAPTPAPINSSEGCCSLDYKNCIDWCGSTYDSCINCDNSDGVAWLPDGAAPATCGERWLGCEEDNNTGHSGCCSGLLCQANSDNWKACLPPVDPTPAPVNAPTPAPVDSPTPSPVDAPTPSPVDAPTPSPVKPPTAPPVKPPTPSPVESPTSAPVKPPTPSPVESPTSAPVKPPTPSPVKEPTEAPVRPPTPSPVKAPTAAPVKPPTPSPVNPPTTAPQTSPTPSPVSQPTDGGGGGDPIDGKATFYGGNPNGNACGYNDLPQVTFPKGFSVAIGGDEFDGGYGCGACYEVTCVGAYGNNPGCFCGESGKNTVIVQATDQCPECSSTHFDLNKEAFTSIVKGQSSGMAGTCGVIETKFRRVSCQFESNIKIRSKSGTSGYWYGLHIDDVAGYGAISSIKLREKGRRQNGLTDFDIRCDKSQGASFWICDRPGGRKIEAPLDVHLTDSAGRTLQKNNVITDVGGNMEFDFRTNFGPIDGSNPPPTTPTTPISQPTPAPVKPPTPSPVKEPTPAPVNAPTPAPIINSNGCCSLDYKNCIDWCGSTYDSCINCSNSDVTWLPNGAAPPTCGERWTGCEENNDTNHSGCCSGLTCMMREGYGYKACLPGDSSPVTPPSPPSPTATPQTSPTPSPVSQPTDGGGGGDPIDGKATFYGGNPNGNACGYNDLPQVTFPKGFSVAIGGDEFDGGYGCGACYEVTCVGAYGNNPGCFCGESGKNTVIVQATDQCPECSSTHFDLNKEAFTSIVKGQSSGMAGTCGVIETKFRRVSCQFESNIKIRSKSGTSGYWYGLHIDDVAGYGAISSIKLREKGRRQNGLTDFDIRCDKSQGASFWICDRPGGRKIEAPLDVHLTDSAGRTLQKNNVITDVGGNMEFDFRTNFGPIDGSNPPPTTPTTPVSPPTPAPVPTKAPSPTAPFSGELLTTNQGLNAWEVFEGLDFITHKNSESPLNYAVVASGGAAGGGNDVVSESQAYGLLITGTVLASWDTHAGKVSGSDRAKVLKYFEGYYYFWKDMCKNSSNNNANCQPNGKYCKSGSNSYVCLPDWKHSKYGGSTATGPAPDGDEDAIVGIMLAVKAVENDPNKPSWYEEARRWADASASAFFTYSVDKSKGDYRLLKLGSCWGGWDNNGNNPSYHSPGSYRVMKDYQESFPDNLRQGYNAVTPAEWTKLIDTSHEVLRAVQCSNGGALVPNWATVGVRNGQIVHTGGSFSGSGTAQYEYGAEAARTTFRVALDAAFYPDSSSEWSGYLNHYNERMSENFQNGSFPSNTFPSCRGPGTNQNINMFGNWQSNAFIYGPTYSALIAASSGGNSQAMIDAAGAILGRALPNSYYPRSWAMISNLMLNGAMESAGNTLKQ